MIIPAKKDTALLEDIRSADPSPDRFHLWWLGQSGFLVKWQDHHLLLDPYLSDSLTKKYDGTDKPHVRMTERAIDPAQLDMINVVTSSHAHTDHLDSETLRPLAKANPDLILVAPEAILDTVRERLDENNNTKIIGLDAGSLVSVDAFMVTAIPAAHNDVEYDERGRCKYLGYVVRFGPFTLYHSGDTLRHDKLMAALAPYRFDLMLLPINGNKPERRVAGNLNGPEAAALAWTCGARAVVPCHYAMFEFNTESPAAFNDACERLDQPHHVLECGERWTLTSRSEDTAAN